MFKNVGQFFETFMGLEIYFIAAIIIFALFIYLLPSLIAISGHRRQAFAIFIVNFFLGWSFLGWLGALIWAAVNDKSEKIKVELASDMQNFDSETNQDISEVKKTANVDAKNKTDPLAGIADGTVLTGRYKHTPTKKEKLKNILNKKIL